MFLVVDLEATCWDGNAPPDNNEIIEIGMVVCDENGDVIGEYQNFVKPKVHPILTDFCKNLTGIKQEDVDKAGSLSDITEDMTLALILDHQKGINNAVWTSWGDFDRKCLKRDCIRNGIEYFMGPHCSSKSLYAEMNNCKRMGVPAALKREGMKFEGSLHRARDDAFNISRIIKANHLYDEILKRAHLFESEIL